jgi:hypothetical protein
VVFAAAGRGGWARCLVPPCSGRAAVASPQRHPGGLAAMARQIWRIPLPWWSFKVGAGQIWRILQGCRGGAVCGSGVFSDGRQFKRRDVNRSRGPGMRSTAMSEGLVAGDAERGAVQCGGPPWSDVACASDGLHGGWRRARVHGNITSRRCVVWQLMMIGAVNELAVIVLGVRGGGELQECGWPRWM